MQADRYLTIRSGTMMIVSDLHGDGDAFDRYVATFQALHEIGEVDRLVFMGDLIHGYGSEAEDASIRMILRVMELQEAYGKETVIMLLGNHEMPHIYGVSLAKGDIEFTPRFEHRLGEHRETILKFFRGLPLLIRTNAGVLLCHAGPDSNSINRATRLHSFEHDDLLRDADATLAQQSNLDEVYKTYAELSGHSYDELANAYLAVTGQDDPRYSHLMRALFISERDQRFSVLWDFLFAQNERGMVPAGYEQVCRRYLDAFSIGAPIPQQVCVSGHIVVRKGGYEVVNKYHLRIASATHARPRSSGVYLMLDATQRIPDAWALVPNLYSIFE
jgi:hypothetical protein